MSCVSIYTEYSDCLTVQFVVLANFNCSNLQSSYRVDDVIANVSFHYCCCDDVIAAADIVCLTWVVVRERR